MKHRRITQKFIANILGLSTQAISMSLRNHPQIPLKTRKKVQNKAKELNYIPDPSLRALADYRTLNREVTKRWNTVAFLYNWETEKEWEKNDFYQSLLNHLENAAVTRGISVEVHWLGGQGEFTQDVCNLLRNRGITGVFLSPPPPTQTASEVRIKLPFEHFQIVTFGPESLYPDFHTVQFDFYENFRLAWKTLWQRGYRKIGHVFNKAHGWRTGHAWEAAFYIEKILAGIDASKMSPLEINLENGNLNHKIYLEWLSRDDYDAVISSVYDLDIWNNSMSNPPEVVYFNVRKSEQKGIDVNLPQMAETAIELLYMEMQRSLVGQNVLPFRVHIPGKWSETV